jgi:type I restriction enzyme, S subunit
VKGWQALPLSDIAIPSGTSAREKTDLPVYSVTKHRGFVPSREYFKKQVFSRELGTYTIVEPGELAYATIHLDEGSIGICPERCLISPMYTTFRIVRSDVHAPFVLRFLKSPRALAEYPRFGKGSVERRRAISFDRLGQVKIPMPPLAEQRRIADVLDHAEALRGKRRIALAKLDTLSQAIFLELFGDPESRGWPMTTIADIAYPAQGSIRTGPFGSQLLHGEFTDRGVAVLGIDNAAADEFRWGDRRFVSEAKYSALKRYTVKPGDVIITIMGTCGRCAVVPDDVPVAISTKHLCCITVDREKCLPMFLHSYFLRHPLARRYLDRTAKGAIMSGLNMGIIRAMPIPIPPIQLQEEFARRVAAVERLKTAHRASLAQLDALFGTLQYRAFRGEL